MVTSTMVLQGRGFPTDFPLLGFRERKRLVANRRGFPTDFPLLGYGLALWRQRVQPWFPY